MVFLVTTGSEGTTQQTIAPEGPTEQAIVPKETIEQTIVPEGPKRVIIEVPYLDTFITIATLYFLHNNYSQLNT